VARTSAGLRTPQITSWPRRRKFGVSNRVLDVLMPEVVLQRSRVVAVIGELENHGYYRVAFDLMPDGKQARWIVA
jgi:hypothetical protein